MTGMSSCLVFGVVHLYVRCLYYGLLVIVLGELNLINEN